MKEIQHFGEGMQRFPEEGDSHSVKVVLHFVKDVRRSVAWRSPQSGVAHINVRLSSVKDEVV